MGGAQQSKFYTDLPSDDDNYGGITAANGGDMHNEMLTRYISIDPFVHFQYAQGGADGDCSLLEQSC